jgi:hypothetical protein
MKRTDRPAGPDTAQSEPPSNPLSVLSRINLAFLDEFSCEKRGYDPYDSGKARGPEIWGSKRKRA